MPEEIDVGEEAIPLYEDVFSSLPTISGVKRKKFIEIPPLTSIDSTTGPIQFVIPVGSNEQILPCDVRIMCGITIRDVTTKSKLKSPVNGAAVKDALCFPVGGMGHALFSDITVYINDQKVDGGDALYAYKGAIQNKLFTTVEQKKGGCELKGLDWEEKEAFEDVFDFATYADKICGASTPDQYHDKLKDLPKVEKVFAQRYIKTQTQPMLHYIDEIYSEIFQQPKALPPKTKLTLHLTRSRPEFALFNRKENESNINCYINFEYCKLLVPILVCEEKMARQMEFESLSKKREFKYPVRKVQIQGVPKNKNMTDLSIDNILTGTITPRRIFISFVKSDALSGRFKLDPFNFLFPDLSEIAIILGGQLSSVPALKCPSESDYQLPIQYLLQTLGAEGTGGIEVGINRDNFKKRNAFFAFDITGMGVELQDCFTKESEKTCGVFIRLNGEGYPENLTIIIYKEYDAEIGIDAHGKVKTYPFA